MECLKLFIMKKKIIHVAKQAISCNLKNNTNDPTIIVRTGNKSSRFHNVVVKGLSEIKQAQEKPLACGARVWIETFGTVIGTNEHGEILQEFN